MSTSRFIPQLSCSQGNDAVAAVAKTHSLFAMKAQLLRRLLDPQAAQQTLQLAHPRAPHQSLALWMAPNAGMVDWLCVCRLVKGTVQT